MEYGEDGESFAGDGSGEVEGVALVGEVEVGGWLIEQEQAATGASRFVKLSESAGEVYALSLAAGEGVHFSFRKFGDAGLFHGFSRDGEVCDAGEARVGEAAEEDEVERAESERGGGVLRDDGAASCERRARVLREGFT